MDSVNDQSGKQGTPRSALHFAQCVIAAALLIASQAFASDLPRTSAGRPDLSGIWQVMAPVDRDLLPHSARSDSPAHSGAVVGGEIPYQQWALARKKGNFEKRATADPAKRCYMPGVPRATYTPLPFQIFQSPKQTTILYEYAHTMRRIYTDGSSHPEGHIGWFMGDSRGRWEGDTLVVDVTHFNDETWLDHAGNFHSDALHVVERYSLLGEDHMQYEATIDDPKVFTRPWTIRVVLYRRVEPGIQLLDYECYIFDYEKFYPIGKREKR